MLKRNIFLAAPIILLLLFVSVNPVLAADANAELTSSCTVSMGESRAVSFAIKNPDQLEHRYTLSIEGGTNHYDTSFLVATGPITELTLAPGTSGQFDLNLALQETPQINLDTLRIKATDENGQENVTVLSVIINPDYQLVLTGLSDRAEILNGKTGVLNFSVKNNGSKAVSGVRLQAQLPNKWRISQGADTTINLKPGETGIFKITVEVPSTQVAGNQQLKLSAVSEQTASNTVSLPVTVKTSSTIAWWMIGVFVIVAGITVIQFRKHGRR